jgi:hypothetical protein
MKILIGAIIFCCFLLACQGRFHLERGHFRYPTTKMLYKKSDLIVSGEIVSKKRHRPYVTLDDTSREWLIAIKVNKIFKQNKFSNIKIGDTITTRVHTMVYNAFLHEMNSIHVEPQTTYTSMPNLFGLQPYSICFFKKVSRKSKIYYEKIKGIKYDYSPWQYDWADVFFPYYTPLDINSQDTILRCVPVRELVPTFEEHRYLKDLLGFPKYPEWQNPRDSYWNKFDPNNKK